MNSTNDEDFRPFALRNLRHAQSDDRSSCNNVGKEGQSKFSIACYVVLGANQKAFRDAARESIYSPVAKFSLLPHRWACHLPLLSNGRIYLNAVRTSFRRLRSELQSACRSISKTEQREGCSRVSPIYLTKARLSSISVYSDDLQFRNQDSGSASYLLENNPSVLICDWVTKTV
ncbi:hypothetical protein SISSUDRAFT_756117 [Sistotremastrum suecicum HHB10207 ss-3]|uniref:Uncharacterized protein n=1 Tax=Sistotremastrum suecicum HHB10207 ss-3 TaxID=1314776 RepID=A0A166DCP8_9AGAM|nr:hypothetical protein SISSUDRAFT_756117 [Sistotremastrum suecicum HHB10207 ss-3]